MSASAEKESLSKIARSEGSSWMASRSPYFSVISLVEGVDLHEEELVLVQEADCLLDLAYLAEDGVGYKLEAEILVVLGEFLPEQG